MSFESFHSNKYYVIDLDPVDQCQFNSLFIQAKLELG